MFVSVNGKDGKKAVFHTLGGNRCWQWHIKGSTVVRSWRHGNQHLKWWALSMKESHTEQPASISVVWDWVPQVVHAHTEWNNRFPQAHGCMHETPKAMKCPHAYPLTLYILQSDACSSSKCFTFTDLSDLQPHVLSESPRVSWEAWNCILS